MAQPSFVVVGAGAVGGFLGILLHDAGYRVRFLVRDSERSRARRDAVSKAGYTALVSVEPDFRLNITPQVALPMFCTDPAECLRDCSCVLVATKRTETEAVHRMLVENGVTCSVVFLQNGVQVSETLRPRAYDAVECVVHYNAVDNPSAGTVTLVQPMSDAFLALDSRSPSAQMVAELISATPVRVFVPDDFAAVQNGKLLLNLLNAVNAMSGIPLGVMLMDASYRLVVAASMSEAKAVFKAMGITPKAGRSPEKLLVRFFVTLLRLPQAVFEALLGPMCKARERAFTSMAQDLNARKVPTEVDYFNGEIVRLGKRFGVPTPVNERLLALIRDAEAANVGCPGMSGAVLAEKVGVPLTLWPNWWLTTCTSLAVCGVAALAMAKGARART